MSDRLEIRTLGGLTIRRGGEPVTGLASRKVDALLVYLACAGRPRPRELLAELLWEERSQERAMGNLRVALSSLRKHLGSYVTISRDEVAIDPDADVWLDARALEGQLSAGRDDREHDGSRHIAQLEQAIGLYQGDFLEGFFLRGSAGFENWAVLERERMRAVYEQSLQLLLDELLASQRWRDVITWGERWIADGQSPEPAFRALMNARSGLGDLASMTAVYHRCVDTLDAELGIEPSEQTNELYERLAAGGSPSVPTRAATEAMAAPTADRAVQMLLARWRRGGAEVLDVASLAVVYASSADLDLGPDEADLIVRSALQHGVDVEPWLERVGSPQAAVQALTASLARYPVPRIRMEIVEALSTLPGDGATDVLERVASSDDSPGVRTEAALAAAGRGRLQEVAAGLMEDLRAGDEAAALPALIAVADEYGLPEGLGPYPRGSLALGLARRRWQARRREIIRQTVRAGAGGAVALALAAVSVFLPALLISPEAIESRSEVVSIGVWLFTNALSGFFMGSVQGAATGLVVGLNDALWRARSGGIWRFGRASLAGLVQSGFQILLCLVGGLDRIVPAAVYLPAFIVYGLWYGGALSLVVPVLGVGRPSFGHQVVRSLLASAVIAAVAVPMAYLVHGADSTIILYLMNLLLYPLGVALALGSRKGRRATSRSRRG